MADELVFYTNPMSRGRIVRWMLEEVGQPYRTQILGFETGIKAPEYLAINPMGKVPALRHGDEVVTECGAICAYLADAFPQGRLAPPSETVAVYLAGCSRRRTGGAVSNKSPGYEPRGQAEDGRLRSMLTS